MTDDTGPGKVYGLLVKAAADIGWVGKDGRNREQGYQFRGIDTVVQHVAPALRKHGIIVIPSVRAASEEPVTSQKGAKGYRVTLDIDFTFYAAVDGSSVTATLRGEGIDYSDKATNKAMSQAFKYALTQVLTLPTDEPDADATSPQQVPQGHPQLDERGDYSGWMRDEVASTVNITKKEAGPILKAGLVYAIGDQQLDPEPALGEPVLGDLSDDQLRTVIRNLTAGEAQIVVGAACAIYSPT